MLFRQILCLRVLVAGSLRTATTETKWLKMAADTFKHESGLLCICRAWLRSPHHLLALLDALSICFVSVFINFQHLFFFILLSNAAKYFTSESSQQSLLFQVDLQSFSTKESCGRPLLVTPNSLSDQTLQIGS